MSEMIDGMTAQQYIAALRTLRIGHRQAAELLGISVRLSQAYAQGVVQVRQPVARLLEMTIGGRGKVATPEHG